MARAYKVIAEFIHAGQPVRPPCEWVPPDDAIARRMVEAKCLVELTEAPSDPLQTDETAGASPAVSEVSPEEAQDSDATGKARGRRRR